MTSGIYCLKRIDTGERYVGKSVNIERRLMQHKFKPLEQTYEVLQECNTKELNYAEILWIDRLKPELNILTPSSPTLMRSLRERVGKRTVEIAIELGIADSTVRNWDSGRAIPRMTPKGMQLLLKVYECTWEELIQAEEEAEEGKQS